ncbi:MAG TPA: AAA family ATPase [Methanomassiliicoccales archaeon]|nr:AAA family ATPase [Methanomassiliicoccales archaeon]
MTFLVAVAGKGGVGKTTISSLLVRALAQRSGEIILAIDADPNANLGERLGVKVERTIGQLREDLLNRAEEVSASASKHEAVRYQLQLAKAEGPNFDLLTMGRPEGPGCYCYINNILRTFIDEAVDQYPFVVIDNEAGMEHLSRRTTKRMDVLLLVSDATSVGLTAVRRISELADEMEIKVGRRWLIVNRCPEELSAETERAIYVMGFDRVVRMPHDPALESMSISGTPVTGLPENDPVWRSVKELAKDLR